MIDERYGYFECGFDGAQFQVLRESTPEDENPEWQPGYEWDEEASAELMWDHWYKVHDKDKDGNID